MSDGRETSSQNIDKLLGQMRFMESSIEGIREHLRQNGVDVDAHRESVPQPRSNPIVKASRWERQAAPEPAPDPLPPPPPPPPIPMIPEEMRVPVERWEEILFRPGMAAAMLFVLMPLIEDAIKATTPDEAAQAIDQMDVWSNLTMAQRVALMDLFAWIETEMSSPDPVIPRVLLSNLAAAQAVYEGTEGQVP